MDINAIVNFLNTQASTSIAGFLIITVSIIAIHYQRKTARQKASLEFLHNCLDVNIKNKCPINAISMF
ncbi:hypothetical protein SPONN_2323 [uncultured Candidatus Thioglobus sp.]|nr:hypothetical protein SPONN_2323 [uncultured Candidatus Thioglobus sp.]